jgi:MOSC domain-containing protein YiiM
MSRATLAAIWIKRFSGGPMDPAGSARLVAQKGLAGNKDQGGKRQVTLISREAWEEVQKDLGRSIDPRTRRANLMTVGITLEGNRGRILRVGAARLLINGETRPCHQMDEAVPGLRAALGHRARGGVYAAVLEDAEISVGDLVEWEPTGE